MWEIKNLEFFVNFHNCELNGNDCELLISIVCYESKIITFLSNVDVMNTLLFKGNLYTTSHMMLHSNVQKIM